MGSSIFVGTWDLPSSLWHANSSCSIWNNTKNLCVCVSVCVCVCLCLCVCVCVCVCVLSHFSHVQLFVTLWTVAHQAPLSMGPFRQEYWSGLPCPPPRDFPLYCNSIPCSGNI